LLCLLVPLKSYQTPEILDVFKSSLPNVPWLDKTSADTAAAKVGSLKIRIAIVLIAIQPQATAIRVKVGYPLSPNTRDPASILQYYQDVDVNNDAYFENILSAAYAQLRK
jgi:endothelin-converting enzyme